MSDSTGGNRENKLSSETAEELYQKAPCGYVSFLKNGKIRNINQTLLSWLGYKREEVVNVKKVQELFKIGGRIYFETHFFPLIRMQGFVKEINLDMRRKDKSSFPGLLNVLEVQEKKGAPESYWATIFDISDRKHYEKELLEAKRKAEELRQKAETERKKAEVAQKKAEEASKAKARFLATISHEIRTPLNAILGIGNLFHKTELDEQQKEYARILQNSSENLLGLVNNVLDLSKIEANKVKLENDRFDLPNLIEVVTKALEIKAREKNLELKISLADEVPSRLVGDSVKLSQILTNLLGNAIKFTEEGGVHLEVALEEIQQENTVLRFSVIDTGIGIPKKKLKSVFGEFSQASYDVKQQYGGTGLGLTISQKLLELHGSTMEVRSELGQGSEFSFKMRYQLGSISKQEEHLETGLPDDFKAAQLLVVDDNPVNIYIIGEFLREWHLSYDSVESGQQAVEAVQERTYDMLLMDLHMPVMSGYDAAKIIRALDLPKQPVIMAVSASAQGDINQKLHMAGINDYVSKPFSPEDLLDKLSRHLRNPEPEKLRSIPSEEIQESSNATKESPPYNKVFGGSRLLKITGGRKEPLERIIDTTWKAIEEYKSEFITAAENKDSKALGTLIHKSTMTLYYAEADHLKVLLEKVEAAIEEKKSEEEVREGIRETLSEFDKLTYAIKTTDVSKLLLEEEEE